MDDPAIAYQRPKSRKDGRPWIPDYYWDLFPAYVCIRQEAWERKRVVYGALLAGVRQKDIAAALGITPARVGQVAWSARLEFEPRASRRFPPTAPIQRWLNAAPDDLACIADFAWGLSRDHAERRQLGRALDRHQRRIRVRWSA